MSTAPPAAPPAGPAPADHLTGTEPPTKSALKRMEKEAKMAAAKALKKATAGPAPVAAGQGKKKEKKVVEVVAEDPYVEVPAGQFKGKYRRLASSLTRARGEEGGWLAVWVEMKGGVLTLG